MSFIDYLIQNYIWLVAVLVIIIITVIGYIADRRNIKRKEKELKKEEQEVIKDDSNMDASVSNIDISSGEMQNWDQIDPNVNMVPQMNAANDLNMYPNENMDMNSQAMFPDPVNMNTSSMIDNTASISDSVVDPSVSMINDNVVFDIPNPVSEPISNNVNSDFSNMNYGFTSDVVTSNPSSVMSQEIVPPIDNTSNIMNSSTIEPVPVIVPTPDVSVETSYPNYANMDNSVPMPEIPVSEPVYENEWDNVQTMEIPNIPVSSDENSTSSSEDADMWRL